MSRAYACHHVTATSSWHLHAVKIHVFDRLLLLLAFVCLETRFVVVREPAERMVSAFMNKCVRGYQRYVVYEGWRVLPQPPPSSLCVRTVQLRL